ncbi:MAG: hypothetical protein V4662_10625 [Verrucomicrobiota bacterium]
MNSILSSSSFTRRISLLLFSAVCLLTLPVNAKDKHHHSSKSRTHHYSPRYNSHSHHRQAYSPRYRGHSNHRHSNYGRSSHSSVLNQLLRRL